MQVLLVNILSWPQSVKFCHRVSCHCNLHNHVFLSQAHVARYILKSHIRFIKAVYFIQCNNLSWKHSFTWPRMTANEVIWSMQTISWFCVNETIETNVVLGQHLDWNWFLNIVQMKWKPMSQRVIKCTEITTMTILVQYNIYFILKLKHGGVITYRYLRNLGPSPRIRWNVFRMYSLRSLTGSNLKYPGGHLNIKMPSYQYRDPMLKMSRDRLIFNMGIPIHGKDGLYIETGPCFRNETIGAQNTILSIMYIYNYKLLHNGQVFLKH